jgi:ABC-type lipoprotein release transport system permease subunit
MRTFRTAARLYAGYKLKALSFLVFITIGLGLIMGAVDLLYNSFNIFFDRPASYFLPRYFATRKDSLDLLGTDYGIADIDLSAEQRAALEKSLSKDFDLVDAAYSWAMFQQRGSQKRFYALVIGVDFRKLSTAFPFFKGKLSDAEIAKYRSSPLVMAEDRLVKWDGVYGGEELTLLSADYFKNYNGIRCMVQSVVKTPMEKDDSLTYPIVYMDLSQLSRLYALPKGRSYPLILAPKRLPHALSIADSMDMARIESACARAPASAVPGSRSERLAQAYSVTTVSVNLHKTFLLYRGLLFLLCAILVIVMMAAISANLAINFQNRRADFGLMKAFGCSDARLLGFVLSENALGLGLPLILACALNAAVGLAVPPFTVLYNFTLSPRANIAGFAVIMGAAVLICLVSSIQPYRYLRRIESVDIMSQE